jgi:hypothetical protein
MNLDKLFLLIIGLWFGSLLVSPYKEYMQEFGVLVMSIVFVIGMINWAINYYHESKDKEM